jgi:hypothetical protein
MAPITGITDITTFSVIIAGTGIMMIKKLAVDVSSAPADALSPASGNNSLILTAPSKIASPESHIQVFLWLAKTAGN